MPDSRKNVELLANKLLAALPRAEQRRIVPYLRQMVLEFEATLYAAYRPIEHVYFPTSGVVSLLLVMKDGAATEVGRIGNEGMLGLPLLVGVPRSQTTACVQIPGEALRMSARGFRQQACPGGPLSGILLRYSQALMSHTERLAACNTWHTVEQRLCRWLLVTHDRVQSDRIEVTQEFLALMFGAHRQSVTIAAGKLQRVGLIRYSRGKLTILDRDGLEQAACECYRAIRRHYDHLFAGLRG